MKALHPQYIVDANQNKTSVVLPIDEWQGVLNAMEELDDIKAYDKTRTINDEVLPFEYAVKEIEKNDR